ncbi:hypothetical protein E0Z10_g2376 [Xylaria hypoxylon]|uniref:U6 snRNA phosphodiesterase n=1 Tax=Xylaria hypoxylon TaxID=37992 RepID=A0A4Z0ZCL6_9PEZI|nr:hypothetical protein E0Z10_g2376 [Xylaria hypoxylon]
MGLVDYSDSSESEEPNSPRAKKQKISDNQVITTSTAKSELPPPLPSAFHDLYASTVRVSASDDPTLHQGRKRVNPHKVGSWPSHLYIEWHPTPTERTTLTTLLSNLQSTLTALSPSTSISIISFLTSDLGAPQPLHISLSRPIVLSTAQKDDFLSTIERSVRSSGIAPFNLTPAGLEWHRTEESARSFLVLRVTGNPALNTGHSNSNSNSKEGKGTEPPKTDASESNPQLTALLRRANTAVTAFGQPALYALARSRTDSSAPSPNSSGRETVDVDNAFHISIAWSFAAPSAELRRATEDVFTSAVNARPSFHKTDESNAKASPGGIKTLDDETLTNTLSTTIKDAVGVMRVRVEGIKAKIGNIVTHVPLHDARGRRNDGSSEGVRGLFGI